eukprot:14209070-Alexandrium_andersonii.AAC.1
MLVGETNTAAPPSLVRREDGDHLVIHSARSKPFVPRGGDDRQGVQDAQARMDRLRGEWPRA